MHFYRRHRISIATVAIVIGGLFALACNGAGKPTDNAGGAGTHTEKACNTWITQQPHFNATTNQVIAKTRSGCDVTPDGYVVAMTLWYHPDNATTYIQMATHTCDTPTPIDPIVKPSPGEDATCTQLANGVCHVGKWQLRVLVTGSVQGRDFGTWHMPRSDEEPQHIKSCTQHIRG